MCIEHKMKIATIGNAMGSVTIRKKIENKVFWAIGLVVITNSNIADRIFFGITKGKGQK